MKLAGYIENAALYRTVWKDSYAKRPTAIVAKPTEMDEALTWYNSVAGRKPEFISSNKDTEQSGVTYISLESLSQRPELSVVVFGQNLRDLRNFAIKLAQYGVRTVTFAKDPQFKNSKYNPDYLKKNRASLDRLFALLYDEESRLTLASVIKQRITGDHGYLRIAAYEEYNHPDVHAEAGDWVLDCGASNGQTSFRFAKQVGSQGRVYAFEPDPSNVAKIKAVMEKNIPNKERITIVSAAVSDILGALRFDGAKGGSSKLNSNGDIEVEAITLDHFAVREGLVGRGMVSFDVEGYEHQAIGGGSSMLKDLRPKLQISAYHGADDLFSLAFRVQELLPEYRFYMGHHDAYHTETDIYALPS
jgi:FkbM family methyltransferase